LIWDKSIASRFTIGEHLKVKEIELIRRNKYGRSKRIAFRKVFKKLSINDRSPVSATHGRWVLDEYASHVSIEWCYHLLPLLPPIARTLRRTWRRMKHPELFRVYPKVPAQSVACGNVNGYESRRFHGGAFTTSFLGTVMP